MKVTLLSYNPDAANLLLFTKSTRLEMAPALLDEIRSWPAAKKEEELKYMANTIPSSWEFVNYAFLAEGVSRAYTHQAVRTRAASYAQQSMRVTKMKGFGYVYPKRPLSALARTTIDAVLDGIRRGYDSLLDEGVPAEDARGILPTNIETNIVCGFNLRTLSELARSRTGGRTQSEYIDVVNAMLDEVLNVHPWAKHFLFGNVNRDYFAEIEAFAEEQFGGDLILKGRLLKIVDAMRKAR